MNQNSSNGGSPKLKLEILEALWTDLKDHAQRNAVFILSTELDLLEAAQKMIEDDAVTVAKYVQTGRIARPTPELMKLWDASKHKSFRFVIIQPYVMIQELGH